MATDYIVTVCCTMTSGSDAEILIYKSRHEMINE